MQSRPHSLAELARRAVEEGTDQAFEYELADFLHEFAARTEREMFAERPPLLRDTFGKGSIYDAYLAAIAVYFSGKFHWPTPAWTRQPERILREPWFATPGRHMRALLLVESPAAFRERNLFVSANALSVA